MRRFLKRLLIFLIPVWCVGILYAILDPFKVLYSYESYYEKAGPEVDRDYVGTVMFDRQHEEYGYNSFIFGNSRSIYYQVDSWNKYLSDNEGNSYFHYDASSETLYALAKKVEYIDKNGCRLKNALLIVDSSLLAQAEPSTTHLSYPSPQITGGSVLSFQMAFFQAFCAPKFIYALIDFRLSGTVKEYMERDHLISENKISYDPKTNEIIEVGYDAELQAGTYYTPDRIAVFDGWASPGEIALPVIGDAQLELLKSIRRIFKRHHTDCKIVVSPLFDQIKLNPKDLRILQSVFGEENVADFSGTNSITTDYRNYYEWSHYRPFVADSIMSRIYSEEKFRKK